MKSPIILILTTLVLTLSSCQMADVRTPDLKENGIARTDAAKGRALLEESVKAMGYDRFADYETYTVKANFDWTLPWSAMPMNALPGNKGKDIQFTFSTNSFDGTVAYLEGRKQGDLHGIQSFQSYEQKEGKALEFRKDKRRNWGIATYHYLLEAPWRLLNAPIITYAGEADFEGQKYDLVFCTWETADPHKQHDQWMVYINRETKFIDLSNLTIRDFFMPFPPNMAEGTVQYGSRKEVNGIFVPETVGIQLLSPKSPEKYVYQISFWDYEFDKVKLADLYPDPSIQKLGDAKPMELE